MAHSDEAVIINEATQIEFLRAVEIYTLRAPLKIKSDTPPPDSTFWNHTGRCAPFEAFSGDPINDDENPLGGDISKNDPLGGKWLPDDWV